MASLLKLGSSLVRAASLILSPVKPTAPAAPATRSAPLAQAAPQPPTAVEEPAPRDDDRSSAIEDLRAQLAVASRERDEARAHIATLQASAASGSAASSSATSASADAAARGAGPARRTAHAPARGARASRARLARDEDATRILLGLLAMGRTHPRLMAEGCDDKDVLESLGVPVGAIRYALREDLTSFVHGVVDGLKGVSPAVFAATAADGAYAASLDTFLASDPVIDAAAIDEVSRAARGMRLLQFIVVGVFRLAHADVPYAFTSALKSETVVAALRDACDNDSADLLTSSTLEEAFQALRARCKLPAPLTAAAALPARDQCGAAAGRGGTSGPVRGAKRKAEAITAGPGGVSAGADSDSDGGFDRGKKSKGSKRV